MPEPLSRALLILLLAAAQLATGVGQAQVNDPRFRASLIPFFLLSFLMMWRNSGHWLGLDRRLHRQYPGSRWFS